MTIGKDLKRWNELNPKHPLCEGHFHASIDNFCELLIDAYKDAKGNDTRKCEELDEQLKNKLPPKVYSYWFGVGMF